METIINPYRDLPARITPAEFEIFCMETLKAVAEKQNLSDFTIKQNQRIETFDGTYQIDVLAEYKVFNCRNIMVVECKKHNKSIERKYVAELYTKVQSIGAQKGLLISTSGFQSDAVKFAGVHGLSLWQICGREIKHIYASGSETPPSFIVFQL